jgi:hypothetical protein
MQFSPIIGYRRNGLPIRLIQGGSQQVTDPPAETPPPGFTPPASQEELDRIVTDRLRREREKFADYGDLKAKAAKLEEIEQANASDLEKAVRKAREEAIAEVQQAANSRLLSAEARALAAEAKFRNPGLAVKAIDLSGVKVSDDGTVDAKAVRALLADLAKDEPYLVDDGKAARPKPDDAQGRPQGQPSAAEQGREQARKRFGTTKQ